MLLLWTSVAGLACARDNLDQPSFEDFAKGTIAPIKLMQDDPRPTNSCSDAIPAST